MCFGKGVTGLNSAIRKSVAESNRYKKITSQTIKKANVPKRF